MSGSSDSQQAPQHGWDASGTLWNPLTMSSHATGPAGDGIYSKLPRTRGRSSGRAVCQVPGCTEPLVDCKPYFKRHLVCQTHAVSPVVSIDGVDMRFCQQCAKFERVTAFDGGNRSCRFRLFRRNVAKHRSQLAKRAAQSSDEPEVRPARPSQAPKSIRVPNPKDSPAGAAAGDIDLDGGEGAAGTDGGDAAGQVAGSPSAPQQDRSGRSSGEPDTRCWDAERAPGQYWGMVGGEDWRNQATSGPSSHSTKRTKLGLSGVGAAPMDAGSKRGVEEELAAMTMAMGTVRVPQQKRRQRAAPTRTREESNSESRTMPSQGNSDVNDDVDAALAPFTSGLRLDMPSEDTTEPSANRAGEGGRPAASELQLVSSASAVRSGSPIMHHEMPPHLHRHPQLTPERALQRLSGFQQQKSSGFWGAAAKEARVGWEDAKEPGQAPGGRLLQGLPRGTELYDAISAMSTEPAERYASAADDADDASAQRLRQMASGMSGLGLRVGGMELGTSSGAAGDNPSVLHAPMALQALSSRLDLTHGDRMVLESLLGLSAGPVALRSMASSPGTTLDDQLYDILHDVIKEGGGDTGWFKGTAAAAAAAPGRAVGSGRGTAAAAGPMAAAYAYLGMPAPLKPEEGIGALTLSSSGSGQFDPSSHLAPPTDVFDGSRLQGPRVAPAWNGLQMGRVLGEPGRDGGVVGRPSTTMSQSHQHQQRQMHLHLQQQQPQGRMQPVEHQLRLQQNHQHQQQQHYPTADLQMQELHEEEKNLEQKLQELQQRKLQLQHQQEHRHHHQPQPQHHQHQHQQMIAPTAVATPMALTPTSGMQHAHPAAGDLMSWGGSAGAGMAAPGLHPFGLDPTVSASYATAAGEAGANMFGAQPQTGRHLQQQHQHHQHAQRQLMMGRSGSDTPSHGGAFGTVGHTAGHMLGSVHPQAQIPTPSGRPCALPPALMRPQHLPPAPPPPPPAGMTKPEVLAAPAGHRGWAGSGWGDVPPLLRGVGSAGSGGDGDVGGAGAGVNGWSLGNREATESPWDDYQSQYDTVRLSLKMMDCTPYDMDPSTTQDLLHQFACEGGRCAVPPPLASVRPGCVRIVVNASIMVDRDRDRAPHRDLDQQPFSVRAGEALGAVRRLAVLNETGVLVQAGSQVMSVDKAGREVALDGSASAASGATATPPVLSRASMAAVYVGARGCFQVFGSGLSSPNVEFWGRMHGVHYQLQLHHTTGDTYALVQLPLLTSCGLLVVEAAAGSDSSLLSDWLAMVVVPSERVAIEINALQGRLPPASLRRLLVDLGSLLDVLPILSQPVNGVCPVVGQVAGASSGCSKNTWRSSSVEPDALAAEGACGAVCGPGDSMGADAGSEAAATEGGVLSFNMSYAGTDSTLASRDGPQKSSSTAKASLQGVPSAVGGSSCGLSAFGDGSSAGYSAAGGPVGGSGGTQLKLSAQLLASVAERNGGALAGGSNVRRLLRCFDPSELLTNGDDETVVQQVLAPEAVRQLLSRAVSVTTFFAQRLLVDSALCAVSALSELYCAFPDMLDGQLAPRPQRGAPCLMHAAVRSRSLALLLALAKCAPVLGDHVNLAWPGPGGITPLHLVAMLAQPYVITGLQFVVPEVRQLWHSVQDENGVTPADLLAQHGTIPGPPPAASAVPQAQAPTGRPGVGSSSLSTEAPVCLPALQLADVNAVSAAEMAEGLSDKGSEKFMTPLASPPQSGSAEREAELEEGELMEVSPLEGAPAQPSPSAAGSWPGWGELVAVVNEHLPHGQAVALPPLPRDEDLGTDAALVAAVGVAELSMARLRRNSHRSSMDGWMGSLTAEEDEVCSEEEGRAMEVAEAAPAAGGPRPQQPPPQPPPPQGGSAMAALTGIAKTVARRFIPW